MYPLLREALSQDKRAEAINDFFGRANNGERFDSVLYVNVLEHIEDDALSFPLCTRHLIRTATC